MLVQAFFLVSGALVAAQSETATGSNPTPTSSSGEPCALLAELASESSSIPAQTAFECLDSVPVDEQGDSLLIDQLKVLWQWQSEYGFLKNTPEDWEFGKLDIGAELDNIQKNLGSYSSEYTVQIAIQNITTRTGNYHFNYQPDILQLFRWRRSFWPVSISEDGKALPKLYTDEDASRLQQGESDVSEITSINGEDPYEYLKKVAAWEQYIDTDGRLNSMFYKGDTRSNGNAALMTQYDGPSTNITFANGTSTLIDNLATTEYSFSGVTDGQSLFDEYLTGQITNGASLKAKTKLKNNLYYPDKLGPHPHIPHGNPKNRLYYPGRLGEKPHIPHGTYHRRNKRSKRDELPESYPTAVIEADSEAVAGYFLTGTGYEDVAVLKIITFSPEGDDTGNEFQAVIQTFLEECQSQNKTKLVIDLRENGGGATHLLLDAFMQLFPEMDPFSGQRYRATEQFLSIGDAVEEIYKSTDLTEQYHDLTLENLNETYRYWSYWNFRNAAGENFASWDDFNGPVDFNSDSFTKTMRYNYSNSDDISIRPDGFFFVNGSRPTIFKPENVVMYTDALCGSSCASFHEELKNIAGVHAVTVGGRPENRPIQTVTGTKGGEVVPLYFFPYYASTIINVSEALTGEKFTTQALNDLANPSQVLLRAGDQMSRLQSQDQVRKGETTGTPLQFIYEASDCKIFYTADSWADPDLAWKQAWDAHSDDSKCVDSSTKHKSSISGGYKPYGPGELKAEDDPQGQPGGGEDKPNDPNAAAGLKGSAAVAMVVAALVAIML